MTNKTYSAKQIALHILSSVDPHYHDISNLKLQKLCYYAQGLMSAMRGVPLFEEKIFAWDHGPIVKDLYYDYKNHGSNPIPLEGLETVILDPHDEAVLDDILAHYRHYSALGLRDMTHEEDPWKDAYAHNQGEITVEKMVEHFLPQIDEAYVEKMYGKKLE